MKKALVGIVIGSESDLGIVKETAVLLKKFKIDFTIRVLSAHRSPQELAGYVKGAPKNGVKVFIAAAGGAAALAGVVASHTLLPVIGIPVETKSLKGLDALLSTVQMPAGIPVACMAIGRAGAKNAAILAAEIIGMTDYKVRAKLNIYRRKMRFKIKKTKIKV